MKQFIYLHIPHTSGRTIKRTLWNKGFLKDIICVHNAQHITENITKITPDLKLYFVLREPLNRIIGEYKHYSRNLKIIGQVNHLTKNDVKHIDLDNILDYCSMEVNRNVLCKFLLLKTDFDKPITDADYEKVEKLCQTDKVIFDKYKFPLDLPNLSSLIGSEIKPIVIVQNSDKNDVLLNNDICIKIKKLNEYDFKFFDKYN
jgi:hypothetical protein